MNVNFNEFWRYTGSLTTPPCTEGIIWNIFKQVILIDDNHLQTFRKNLYSKDYRDPQPIYNRLIYRSYSNEDISSESTNVCCSKNN